MPVESESEVTEILRVQNSNGEREAPATERSARQASRRGDVQTAQTAGDYPFTIDPDVPIFELLVLDAGADTVLKITTTGEDTFSVPMNGNTAVFDRWEIDSVEVQNGSDQTTIVGWAGE